MRTAATATIALGLVLAACSLPTPTGPTLNDREFLSTSVTEDGIERPLVPGTRISLRFQDDQIGASAGCNIFGGGYRVDGGRLVIAGGAMTEMACDEPRSNQDDWLFAFLGARPLVQLSGDNLVLATDRTVIVLVDREVAVPDLPLVGPLWTVESIIVGDAVASVPDQVVGSLLFAAGGRVFIDTGCNRGGARFEEGADTLRFTDLVITEASCEAPFGELEAPMLAVLRADVVRFAIDADVLEIHAGPNGLQLRGT
jgi:heat shock protein HslJ